MLKVKNLHQVSQLGRPAERRRETFESQTERCEKLGRKDQIKLRCEKLGRTKKNRSNRKEGIEQAEQ